MAWRAWNLISSDWRGDPYLWSLVHSWRWDGPVMHADEKPTRANTNGIYALRTLEGVPFGNVWGEVALSGVVIEGEWGYRAEVATIRSLYLGREQRVQRALDPDGYHAGYTFGEWPDAALLKALEERYKVDVVVAAPRVPQPVLTSSAQVFMQQQLLNQPIPQNVRLISSASTSVPFGGVFGTGGSNI